MTIEIRHEDAAGFVYTSRTRLGFSPIRTVRRDFPKSDALILWAVSRWPTPTTADIADVIDQMERRFPGRALFVDGEEGPVPVTQGDGK
jgi:hypothetical protein